MASPKRIFAYVVTLATCVYCNHELKCSSKWLSGYRIASAQPQKTVLNLSLRECEEECVGWVGGAQSGCAAFAYGVHPPYNNTCELAIAPLNLRISRATPSSNMSLVDKSPPWDVYVVGREGRERCGKGEKSYLMERDRGGGGGGGGGLVPIDCFYRLMSGKRLSKTHALKSISVSTLPECQDACIREASFSCRSVSYRYMPSGYSYPVANCELSPFYLQTQQSDHTHQYDFIDDFDYDYFQREPFCKTTAGGQQGGFGVCAVVVRKGGRMSLSLIKSSHQTSTPSQCEHLCTTSLFRCRAFAFRHTDRGSTSRGYGGGEFPRGGNSVGAGGAPCQLYESDLSRLPSYNVEPDMDFDLYEMGRLIGGECMLNGQWGAGGGSGLGGGRYRPVTSTSSSLMGGGGDRWGQGQQGRERYPYDQYERYPPGSSGYDRYPVGGGGSGGSGGYYGSSSGYYPAEGQTRGVGQIRVITLVGPVGPGGGGTTTRALTPVETKSSAA
ncbi:uncharacterized protein LOC110859989 [Folsomia candida]|uniref:uncharacterized protein LOC110859989 n=1 Tax=Folsomia candida TaxID=158441 RepID=UPI000B9019D8|nr:uncharacterized protein LOC110859989 [Folsomia candida]